MSRENKSRSLEWGRARRPEINTSLSSPEPREGSEGDIQVRNTNTGAKLFAKLGGRWLSTPLEPEDHRVNNVKMHYFDFTMTAGTTEIIYLPDFIAAGSVVGINFMMNHSEDYWCIDNWADISDDDGTSAETGPYVTRYRALYRRSIHGIIVSRMGTQADDGKQVKMVVFYI